MSPSPQTPAGGSSISGDQNMILLYQFVIPQEHVGKLIGKNGQFINTIKSNSNTRIYIKKHPVSFKKKICALEGKFLSVLLFSFVRKLLKMHLFLKITSFFDLIMFY